MEYTLPNKKTIVIDDSIIRKSMKALSLTQDEAIQMYLEDEGYLENDEQIALDASAKKVKIQHGAYENKPRQKPTKPRVTKVSNEKKLIFDSILQNLDRCELIERENITILKENKLIEITIGDKKFKIDLIEQRPPKKNK